MPLEVKVLIRVFPGYDLLDLSAMEVMGSGGPQVTFKYTIASHTEDTKTAQGVTTKRDKSFAQAMHCIGYFHLLIQPGGGLDKISAYRQVVVHSLFVLTTRVVACTLEGDSIQTMASECNRFLFFLSRTCNFRRLALVFSCSASLV